MAKGVETKNLFKCFNVSEDKNVILIDCVSLLNEDDKNIIYRRCGVTLDGTSDVVLNTTERSRFYNVLLPKLRMAYEMLSEFEYGSDLYKDKIDYLDSTFNKKGGKGKTANLIDYFNKSFTYDEIKKVVDSLDENERDIVYCVCGPLLNGVDTKAVSKEQRLAFNTKCIPKIKTRLAKEYPGRNESVDSFRARANNSHGTGARKSNQPVNITSSGNIANVVNDTGSLVSTISGNSTNKGEDVVAVQTAIEDNLNLKEKSGDDQTFEQGVTGEVVAPHKELENDKVLIDNQTAISGESLQSDNLVGLQHRQIAEIKDEKGFTKTDYEIIQYIINSNEFKEMIKMNFPIEEVMVATMLHYGYQGKKFSIDEIALFLNTSRENVVDIARRSTQTYRELINKKLDMYEETLIKGLK